MNPMKLPTHIWITAIVLLSSVCLARPAAADDVASISASLPTATVHAGDKTTLTITTAVADGFHVESNTPTDPKTDIKFEVVPTTGPTVEFGPVKYPTGENKPYPAGTANVYDGTFDTTIPVTIAADAKPGELVLRGTVTYQACDDNSCRPPVSAAFEVKVQIVPGEQTLQTTTRQSTTAPTIAGKPGRRTKSDSEVFGFDLKTGGLGLAIPIGFVVGIIFNLMPCVLPVVPLKIMGFYEASRHNRARSLGLGAAFSIGMVGSFAALGLLIFSLQWIDWGGLFQKTWFVALIVAVMTLMALGTFGLFSVALPGNLYNVTPRHDTVSGNVLFGILTAALSTPCTFGVFAALLAWLITQPAWVGIVVMTSVGLGMAAPYLALSGFPEVARRFPRTGPWSEVVKQFMAFLLLATAVYFAQPFFAKFDAVRANWWSVFGVIAAGSVFLVVRGVQLHKSPVAIWVTSIIAILIITPSAFATHRLTLQPYPWIAYSDKALADGLKSGRPVVVDFTAAWCGNCHYIEGHTLNAGSVVRAVHDQNALMLRADIDTAPDAKAKLSQLEPTGAIPLTAVYRPGRADPDLLVGIYSDDDLVDVMNGK
jgi:thiol:disulfide interchange protein DsbD